MTIFVTICSVIGTLFTIYYLFTSFYGLLTRKHRQIPRQPARSRIAAVIAARNESAVIGKLVESLLAQNYPRALYDIYVIPNNCTDDTEDVARRAGAGILHVDGPIRVKGDVLRGAFAQLSATGRYDAYCVFDADNLVDKGFMQAVNDALAAGYGVAQGYRDSKNPFDNWVSGSLAAFYWFMSRFYNESRSRLGMPVHLNGTGFMVSDAVLRRIGWHTHSLTEDQEFTAQCALNDIRIGWMPDARIYDEQTTGFWVSCVQRRRWTSGSMQCLRRYLPSLMKKRTLPSLDMMMLFLGNLMCIIGLVPAVGTALGMLPFFISHPWRVLALVLAGAVYYLACCGAAAVLYRAEGRLNRRALAGVFGFPIFLLTWMPVNIFACLTPPPHWKEIRHVRDMEKPDNACVPNSGKRAAGGAKITFDGGSAANAYGRSKPNIE